MTDNSLTVHKTITTNSQNISIKVNPKSNDAKIRFNPKKTIYGTETIIAKIEMPNRTRTNRASR